MDRERLIKQAEVRRSRILSPSEVSYRKRKRNKRFNINTEETYATNQEGKQDHDSNEERIRFQEG